MKRNYRKGNKKYSNKWIRIEKIARRKRVKSNQMKRKLVKKKISMIKTLLLEIRVIKNNQVIKQMDNLKIHLLLQFLLLMMQISQLKVRLKELKASIKTGLHKVNQLIFVKKEPSINLVSTLN